jgi:hypothetical protein
MITCSCSSNVGGHYFPRSNSGLRELANEIVAPGDSASSARTALKMRGFQISDASTHKETPWTWRYGKNAFEAFVQEDSPSWVLGMIRYRVWTIHVFHDGKIVTKVDTDYYSAVPIEL